MKINKTDLPEVLLIEPRVFGDSRGCFLETFNAQRYAEQGIDLPLVQDNFSRSSKGVLRGLHYQLPYTQGKLVWVNRGSVLDVVVDIRRGSPRFGKFICINLTEENHHQLYIPPGFAHGFYSLSDSVDFCYKCTDYYHPQAELGVRWDDPSLNIPWPLDGQQPILSDKDSQYPCLKDIAPEQLPVYP